MSPWWVLFFMGLGVFLFLRGVSWKLLAFGAGILAAIFILPHDVMAFATAIGNGFSNFIDQYNLH